MSKCADIMTKNPVTCAPEDSVDRVALEMKRNDIGPMPIVDSKDGGRLVGIVTDRDLTLKIVAEGRDPKRTKVQEVMTRDVVTCRSSDNIQQALDAMCEHQIRRIPIVDERERLVGMIAQADVATRVDEPEQLARVVEDISQKT